MPACVHMPQVPEGPWESDEEIADERYVAASVKGKGVVVFSACSHAGGPSGRHPLPLAGVARGVDGLCISCWFHIKHEKQLCGPSAESRASGQLGSATACINMAGAAGVVAAGIVNVMKDVQQRTGKPPYAVFGGGRRLCKPAWKNNKVVNGCCDHVVLWSCLRVGLCLTATTRDLQG